MKNLRLGASAALLAALIAPPAFAQTSLDHTPFKWVGLGGNSCLLVAGKNFDQPVIHENDDGTRYTFAVENGLPCPKEFVDHLGPVAVRPIAELKFGPSSLRVRDQKGRWYIVMRDKPNVFFIRRLQGGNV